MGEKTLGQVLYEAWNPDNDWHVIGEPLHRLYESLAGVVEKEVLRRHAKRDDDVVPVCVDCDGNELHVGDRVQSVNEERWTDKVSMIQDDRTISLKNTLGKFVPSDFRRVPSEKSLVPWTSADVPPVCWVRNKRYGIVWLVSDVQEDVVVIGQNSFISWTALRTNYEWSPTPQGPWQPCGKQG